MMCQLPAFPTAHRCITTNLKEVMYVVNKFHEDKKSLVNMINTRRVAKDLQKAFITFGNDYFP